MKPYYEDNHITLYNGDARNMAELGDESVQMVCTSPPYWGLRKYSGVADLIWGGKDDCEHRWGEEIKVNRGTLGDNLDTLTGTQTAGIAKAANTQGSFCSLCGAWKGSYGLEPTPEMYIEHTLEFLREIRRVLRKDGVVFFNIGDSYYSSPSNQHSNKVGGKGVENIGRQKRVISGLSLKIEDASWLAALVDGEGSIFIHKQKHHGKKNVYQADIQVAMKDKQCVERACIITGLGHLLNEKNGCWRWQVRGQQAAKVIRAIYPWLLIKREQAKIACHVADEMVSRKAGFGRELSKDEMEKRQSWYNLCRAINANNGIKSGLPELTSPTSSINLKPKDMCLIPQRIAAAAQEDGWYVRSVIIWSKPNPMPESVTNRPTESHEYILMLTKSGVTQYWAHRDCGGTRVKPKADYRWVNQATKEEVAVEPKDWKLKIRCPQCEATGVVSVYLGLDVWQDRQCDMCHGKKETQLWKRINLWRGHDYYWDQEGVREEYTEPLNRWGGDTLKRETKKTAAFKDEILHLSPSSAMRAGSPIRPDLAGRNIRSVWEFPTRPYPEAHFAVFPEKLPEICIKAATPEMGCCSNCGSPYERVVEKKPSTMNIRVRDAKAGRATPEEGYKASEEEIAGYPGNHPDPGYSLTIGWQPTCKCNADKASSIVLDPFAGAGTSLWVAKKLGRKAVGYELSREYVELAINRCRQQTLDLQGTIGSVLPNKTFRKTDGQPSLLDKE